MIGLLIFLGVVLFLWLLLRVPLVVTADYDDVFTAQVRWLSFSIARFPAAPKKPKKEKKKKDKPAEAAKEEASKAGKSAEPGVFARFYKYQGIPGFLELLTELKRALGSFGRSFGRAIWLRRFDLQIVVTGGEPADLAQKYGKLCAALFPLLGDLGARVRHSPCFRRRVDIHPEFTGWDRKNARCGVECAVIPSTLLRAVLVLALRLLLRVVRKFLKGAKPPKPSKSAEIAVQAKAHKA
ncbi:MAG: hypothetical protein LBC83_06810 [Oscillospiraceae bacterium]|jgi:hypothetical protein|nr:hypothetical protein [Oscillospiraceae bacterium]